MRTGLPVIGSAIHNVTSATGKPTTIQPSRTAASMRMESGAGRSSRKRKGRKASASSEYEAGRRAGVFARHSMTSADRRAGTSGLSWRGETATSLVTRANNSRRSGASKGARPVSR